MSASVGQDIVSPFTNVNCVCGISYTYYPQGGILCSGSGKVSGGRSTYVPSGGAICGGSATYSIPTQPFNMYNFVYHLKELSTLTTGEYHNSASALNATGVSIGVTGHAPNRLDGIYYKAQETDRSCAISVPQDYFNNITNMTVSCWVRNTTTFMNGTYFQRGVDDPSSSQGMNIILGKNLDQTIYSQIKVIGTAKSFTDLNGDFTLQPSDVLYTINGVNPLTYGCWSHIATTWDTSGVLKIYLNGSLEGSLSGIPYNKFLNNYTGSFIARPCSVDITEVRVSSDVKTSQWINTEYTNGCSPQTLYTCGNSQEIL